MSNALLERSQMIPPVVNFNLPEPFRARRGDVFIADMSGGVGSEQIGMSRYVLNIQNDIGNRFSPTVIVAAITSQLQKAKLPTHVEIPLGNGLPKFSILMLEQLKTIDKQRLIKKVATLNDFYMSQVDKALIVSAGLFDVLERSKI